MLLNYLNLDDVTRKFMIEEIDLDIGAGVLYPSPWLTESGSKDYPGLLRQSAESYDDEWLANQLRANNRIRHTSERKKRGGGGLETYHLPPTAPETMAGEFNVYYVRGLCRRAIDEGVPHLVIYRARGSEEPRASSLAQIGTKIDPQATLDDLRQSHGTKPTLGFPAGPNTGLSAKLP